MIENPCCKDKCWLGKWFAWEHFIRLHKANFDFIVLLHYFFINKRIEIIFFFNLFLLRMGSFNSAPKIQNADTQDDCVEVPNHVASSNELVDHCRFMRGEMMPDLLPRSFYNANRRATTVGGGDVTDGLRMLELNAVSKGKLSLSYYYWLLLIRILFTTWLHTMRSIVDWLCELKFFHMFRWCLLYCSMQHAPHDIGQTDTCIAVEHFVTV